MIWIIDRQSIVHLAVFNGHLMTSTIVDLWREFYPDSRFAWWYPFPDIYTSTCSVCPPSRKDSFKTRSLNRSTIIIQSLPNWIRTVAVRRRVVLITFGLALAISSSLEGLFLVGNAMKHSAVILIVAIVTIASILGPVLLEHAFQIKVEGLASVLYNAFLTAWSVMASYIFARPIAARDAKRQWLPFAETACNSLITIGYSAERMRKQQARRCDKFKCALPAEQAESMKPLLAIVSAQCEDAAERLASVRDQVGDARKAWEAFIRQHCENPECEAIAERLKSAELRAKLVMDEELG